MKKKFFISIVFIALVALCNADSTKGQCVGSTMWLAKKWRAVKEGDSFIVQHSHAISIQTDSVSVVINRSTKSAAQTATEGVVCDYAVVECSWTVPYQSGKLQYRGIFHFPDGSHSRGTLTIAASRGRRTFEFTTESMDGVVWQGDLNDYNAQ